MIVIRKDLPRREGEAVLMREDNSSAVQWVLNYEEGKDDVRVGSLMRVLGALEVKGKWCFQAKHVAGVHNSLANFLNRCEHSKINAEIWRQRPDVNWCEQVMAGEEKCSAILRGDTRSDVLRRRLEGFIKELGSFG